MLTGPGKGRATAALAIGCDVGGTGIKTVAVRGDRIVARGAIPTPSAEAAPAVIAAIAGAAREARARTGGGAENPTGITLGVGLPGFLDPRRAKVIHLSNLPALDGLPLRAVLRRRLGWPVILEADSNCGAYGEWRLGAGRGARRLLFIALGTGVGAAMVADGTIVRVANNTVGQVAHLPLDPDPRGPRCPCGSRGCLEAVLRSGGIRWRARRAARAGIRLDPEALADPAGLVDAARSGSAGARRVLAEVGGLLGSALAVLANFLSPDRIVVGGGIAGAGDLLLGPAALALRRRVHPRLRDSLRLYPSALGPFSGAAGAALLGREAARPGR
jgi:glucokinase